MGGTSQASQADVFTRLIQTLIDYSSAQAVQARGGAAGDFYNPRPPNSGTGNPLTDIESLAFLFDREDLYEMFRKAMIDQGVVGDLTAILVQGDFVASMQRAYLARHHSAIRCRAHGAARHRGHGDENGILNRGFVHYMSEVLKQAAG